MIESDMFQVEALDKVFVGPDGPTVVFEDLTLNVPSAEFLAIVGPSGCGKTTLLRLLAGLETAPRGRLLFEGRPINGPPQRVGYLPQSYDLFPWKTVSGNIAVGLLQSRLSKPERDKRIAVLITQIDLNGFELALPKQLSGGMRQRVALARTLATPPEALLLDEPFGALDAQTRSTLGQFVRQIFEARTVRSVVLVTHDLDEAVKIADRIVVLSRRPARIVHESMTRKRDQSAPADDVLIAESRRLISQWAV